MKSLSSRTGADEAAGRLVGYSQGVERTAEAIGADPLARIQALDVL